MTVTAREAYQIWKRDFRRGRLLGDYSDFNATFRDMAYRSGLIPLPPGWKLPLWSMLGGPLGGGGSMGYVLGRGAGAAAAAWWPSGGVSAANCVAAKLQRLCGKRTLNRHTAQDASTQSIVWNAKLSGPVGNGLSLAIVGDESIPSRVVGLLNVVRPSAIFWRIWPVAINAFNGVFGGWSRPHVGVEILERVSPSVAHDDASAAVMLEYLGTGIVASRFNADPNVVLWSVGHSMRGAVPLNTFRRQASAAFRVATGQIGDFRRRSIATFAKQFPVGATSLVVPVKCDNGQSVELATTIIFDSATR